jgi:hypothetical protein
MRRIATDRELWLVTGSDRGAALNSSVLLVRQLQAERHRFLAPYASTPLPELPSFCSKGRYLAAMELEVG